MTIEPKNAKLRELHEAATPGPWCVEEPMDQELWLVQDGKPTYEWYPLATCPWPDDGDGVPRKAVEANAALIVHLRNNVEHYIAQDARIAELEAEVARLKNQSEWFYHGDDQGSDKCRFSVFEVIDEDVYYDDPRPGKKIVHITTARRCADIWAVVHIFSDAEKDERDDDEPYSVSEYATEEQARAALGEQQP